MGSHFVFFFFPHLMVFYQVIIVSGLHFRNLDGVAGQENVVWPKDVLPAVTPPLPHQLQCRRPSRAGSVKSKFSPNNTTRKIKLLV